MSEQYNKSAKEIARIFDCHPKTILKATKTGQIPAKVVGSRFKYNEAEVVLALSNNKKKT